MPGTLPQAIAKLNMKEWPAPVIRMYLGQMTPAAVLAAADNPNGAKKTSHVCEANFYFLFRRMGAAPRRQGRGGATVPCRGTRLPENLH